MEDYVVLSQTVDKQNKSVFNKVLRKSDDAIFEVGVTKNKHGVCYGIFFEGNDYRKMGIAFIKGEDIMPFRLNDAPKDEKDEDIFYFANNKMPSDLFQTLLESTQGGVFGERALHYRELLMSWNPDKFVYSQSKKEFTSLDKKSDKNITDYKYLIRIS